MNDILTKAQQTAGEVEVARRAAPFCFGAPHRYTYQNLPPGTGTAITLLTRRQRLVAWLRSFLRRFS